MKYAALALAFFLQEGRSRNVVHEDGRAIEVRPAVSTPDRHASCAVAFPEESIETLVAAWNEADLSIERRKNLLFLKLLRPAEGDLHVIGSSGTHYRISIKPGDDGSVRILRPAAARRDGTPPSLELVRAMRLGQVPADTTVRRGASRLVLRAGAVEARCQWVYESAAHVGYVLEVKNPGEEPVRIDPSVLRSPDLVLAGSREAVVPPKGSTLLYLVFSVHP